MLGLLEIKLVVLRKPLKTDLLTKLSKASFYSPIKLGNLNLNFCEFKVKQKKTKRRRQPLSQMM